LFALFTQSQRRNALFQVRKRHYKSFILLAASALQVGAQTKIPHIHYQGALIDGLKNYEIRFFGHISSGVLLGDQRVQGLKLKFP